MNRPPFPALLATARQVASEVSVRHADDVDARARFPQESLDALRETRLLAAAVPREQGGFGHTLREQAMLCGAIAQGCAASGMVLAMHLIEVACLARHASESPWFRTELQRIAEEQVLIASVTSEVGTSGDTRSSVCAIQSEGARFGLEKNATTVSYGAQADALLVTARRAEDAAPGDQSLVYLKRGEYTLEPTSTWNTLGMRGTCSPGARLVAEASCEQILPAHFAEVSAQTMVPFSHVLWAAVWWGIASDAVSRAAAFVRGQARQNPGTVPPAATSLAHTSGDLHALELLWSASASAFDALGDSPAARETLLSLHWALRMNQLKVQASEAAPRIVHQALQVIGVMGYRNDSRFSVGRQLRDSLSASLMISNERLAAKSASMLLVLKDV